MKKIIVAIHGIGNQKRGETIRAVANQFGLLNKVPLPVQPLGFFSGNSDTAAPFEDIEINGEMFGFAEVYWADLPRALSQREDTLEESKAWGQTVAGRAQAFYTEHVKDNAQLKPADFRQASGVIDEIVEGIGVLENLLSVAAKAGLFNFSLAALLSDYIGGVQLVADFSCYRREIVDRFHSVLTRIVAACPADLDGSGPEIYVVAHSEGTVVSFLAMLEALSQTGHPASIGWIKSVRGYMTIGSPIDKHILLWWNLWTGMRLTSRAQQTSSAGQPVVMIDAQGRETLTLPQAIQWRNYYDCGDPVGFQLDTAKQYLAEMQCGAFEFGEADDIGFSRYWVPGKAHTDYWKDPEVFGHFIRDVVRLGSATAPQGGASAPTGTTMAPPKNKPLVIVFSPAIPYLFMLVLHQLAVFVLFKAVLDWFGIDAKLTLLYMAYSVGGLGLTLSSITVAARLPRLTKIRLPFWPILAITIFCVGTWLGFWLLRQGELRLGVEPQADPLIIVVRHLTDGHRLAFWLGALFMAATGWIHSRPRSGRFLLLGAGTVLIGSAITYAESKIGTQQPVHAVWPEILAGLMALYLWWLGLVLFDLAFVWHRYIRRSVAIDAMRDWRAGIDAQPRGFWRRRPRPLVGHVH